MIINITNVGSLYCKKAIGKGSKTAITEPITGIKFKMNVNVPNMNANSNPRNQYIKPAAIPVKADVKNFVKIYFFTNLIISSHSSEVFFGGVPNNKKSVIYTNNQINKTFHSDIGIFGGIFKKNLWPHILWRDIFKLEPLVFPF